MVGTKRLTTKSLKYTHKIIPYWQIGILFPNGKKLSKPQCSLEEVFNTYFIKLENYLNSGLTAEELLDKYVNTFKSKGIKVVIRYVDSWNHTWKDKSAWPKKSDFIEYLNNKLNKYGI